MRGRMDVTFECGRMSGTELISCQTVDPYIWGTMPTKEPNIVM